MWILNKKKEPIKVKLEYFEKNENDLWVDKKIWHKTFRYIYDHIFRTYKKYMYQYGNDNIVVLTNEVEPQIYKIGMFEIKIENEKI